MEITPEIAQRLEQLEAKYATMGQDMVSYLDGLLYSEYLTYWDYIHLDVLLNLQTTETPFDDEMIFITYHQITELYFKLILQSIDRIANEIDLKVDFFINHLQRINRYFEQVINSFSVMIEGMDKDEFLKFRMALLPASGFQSAQFRMIEMCSTPIDNLIHHTARPQLEKSTDLNEKYQYLYWKRGATELATGKKTLTLRQFEEKYSFQFIHTLREYYHKNIWQKFCQLSAQNQKDEQLIAEMRQYDVNANIQWPLQHFRSAARYLQRDSADIAATGGTNWQEYLPPKFQLIMFFPDLWSAEEKSNWGRPSKLGY